MGSETRHRRSEGQAWAADTSSADGVLPCSGAPTMTLWPPRRAAPLTSIRQACPTEAPSLHLAPCPAHLHSALGRGWGIPCAAQRVSGRGSSYILGCRWLLIRDSDLEQGRPRDSFKWVTGSLGHGRGWAAMSMLPPTQGSPGVAPGDWGLGRMLPSSAPPHRLQASAAAVTNPQGGGGQPGLCSPGCPTSGPAVAGRLCLSQGLTAAAPAAPPGSLV